MSQKLVIVESPAKAKTIKQYLGRGYKVEASMGHIRDLPKSQLGVNVEQDFEPKYITIRGKGEIINKLKKEAKNADKVFLATDPDREGEAISWHLAHLLKIDGKSACRIEFNEITNQAVKNAIKKPRSINMNLVDAQQARRILDRVVGYKISPLLWRKIRKGLSAGRVQSVATRLICQREKEIQEFRPEEYWTLVGIFQDNSGEKIFEGNFYGKLDEKIELKNQSQVENILNELKGITFSIDTIKKGIKKRNPSAPFTTSTMQQEASRKLGFTTKKTMMLAQQLYEGIEIKGEGSVGLITYIRTDSTRVSADAQVQAKEYIMNKYGEKFVPNEPNQFKGKKNIQDAHEGIRPSYLLKEPEKIKDSLKRDQYRLYRLIYERFLASQMVPAIYETLSVKIVGKDYLFKTTSSKKTFPGYSIIYEESSDEGEKEKEVKLPELFEGEELTLKDTIPEQHFTQAPPRYTEASLVRILEEKGIGRPSTYAPTISTIISRGYIVIEDKSLYPTELGFLVNDLMVEFFPDIIDYDFTAGMEEQLDEVEEGKKDWKEVIRSFYPSFQMLLENADNQIDKIEIQDEETDIICEKCGTNMVIKMGRYGKFLACPNFPDCRNTKPIFEEIGVPCPKCQAKIVVRKTKKGRKFYGCENYPECDFLSWDLPSKERCPECGSWTVIKSKTKEKEQIKCSNKDCGWQEKEERN